MMGSHNTWYARGWGPSAQKNSSRNWVKCHQAALHLWLWKTSREKKHFSGTFPTTTTTCFPASQTSASLKPQQMTMTTRSGETCASSGASSSLSKLLNANQIEIAVLSSNSRCMMKFASTRWWPPSNERTSSKMQTHSWRCLTMKLSERNEREGSKRYSRRSKEKKMH